MCYDGDDGKSSDSNGADDTDKSSSSKAKDSSSSSSKNKSSSSYKAEDVLPESGANQFDSLCEYASFTVETSGPTGVWGDFGYVIPYTVTKSKTQNLYLAFDTLVTSINGPYEWTTFGVMIAQYDSEKNTWVPGTEIFSRDTGNALPLIGEQYSTVNTYGVFEKFSFDTEGTWLEEYATKSIKIVVSFYAPGIPSDSSGTGLDYYSIPTSPIAKKLYYSQGNPNCSVKLKGYNYSDIDNTCFVDKSTVYQGDTVFWSLPNAYYDLRDRSWLSVTSVAGEFVGVSDKAEFLIAYPTLGEFEESLKIRLLPGVEINCKAYPGWVNDGYAFGDVLKVLER